MRFLVKVKVNKYEKCRALYKRVRLRRQLIIETKIEHKVIIK